MPLVRFQVRNEYGLGKSELYKAADKDDPKAILDGVSVSGLVGILRLLGDLAEFAAEVFHDVQEQVVTTASRSRKMMIRVQRIEAALPPLEKAVRAQKTHIHFAYTAGSDWHARIQTEQNHIINSELPQFILDSYEECRDVPHFHLLDKFDTGGPGSCLKRYTDPSFFKRVLASSDLENAEKVQREKKAHKSKKRGLRNKNVVSRGASLSSCSGSLQYASRDIHGKNSAAEPFSTFDLRLNTDLENRSILFDSRSSSGYIECVSNVSSTLQPEEREHNELSSSTLSMQCNGALDSVHLDKQSGVTDDDLPHRSLEKQSAPISSYASWDEKTEILKSTLEQCDSIIDNHDEVPELPQASSRRNRLEKQAVNLGNVNHKHILFNDGNALESISGENQFDEIGSETDNYMDALNTMASKIETESECQKKQEVDLYLSNSKIKGKKGGTDMRPKMAARLSDSYEIESCAASYSSSNNEIPQNLCFSVTSANLACAQPPNTPGMLSNPHCSPDTVLCESSNCEASTLESIISDPSSSCIGIPNSQESSGDKIVSSLCKSLESSAEIASAPLVKFWTNGGLLGLEPSKPPPWNVSNVGSQDTEAATKYDARDPSRGNVMPKGDGFGGELNMLVKTPECFEKDPISVRGGERVPDNNKLVKRTSYIGRTNDLSECPTSRHNNLDNDLFTGKNSRTFSSTLFDTEMEKSKNSHYNNSFSTHGHNFEVTCTETPVAVLPVTPVGKTSSTEAFQENIGNSSSMSRHGCKLRINGFQRKESCVSGDKSGQAFSLKTGFVELQEPLCSEQNGQKRVAAHISGNPNLNEQFEYESSANSVSSSPPLEHMKISFHPINGSEASKLKLKFSDEHNCLDAIFPSFQLLPEPAIPFDDFGSDSDDDTFCKSSPYMSDDLSHYSQSNSEQWESDEIPGSKYPEFYDALRRVSPSECITSSLEFEEITCGSIHIDCDFKSQDTENGAKPFHYDPLLDLPSFEAVKPSSQLERITDSDPKDVLDSDVQCPNGSTPPLPPFQWRIMKPICSAAKEKVVSVPEVLNHQNSIQLHDSTTCQQPKPTPPNQPHTEAIAFPRKSKDQPRSNGWREADQPCKGVDMEEKEDFLQQIRTKSLSLKRAVTARSALTPGPTINIGVSAILEKANVIRQAVGSDYGGDDESWSDG